MKRKPFILSPDKNSSLIKIKNQHNLLIIKYLNGSGGEIRTPDQLVITN